MRGMDTAALEAELIPQEIQALLLWYVSRILNVIYRLETIWL